MENYITLAPDKTKPRKFLYHKHPQEIGESKTKCIIVYVGDEKEWYPKGWENTPAAFFDMKAHGVPESKIPELHKEIDDIKNLANDDINLDAMNAKELKAFAKKYLPGMTYPKLASGKLMLKLIREAQKQVEKEEQEFLNDDSIKNS
jgi:hypothetical protein